MRFGFLPLLAFVLIGCASDRLALDRSIVVDTRQVDMALVQVRARAIRANMPEEAVRDIAMMSAAEQTLRLGYASFVIVADIDTTWAVTNTRPAVREGTEEVGGRESPMPSREIRVYDIPGRELLIETKPGLNRPNAEGKLHNAHEIMNLLGPRVRTWSSCLSRALYPLETVIC
jgi:hypothetical protein